MLGNEQHPQQKCPLLTANRRTYDYKKTTGRPDCNVTLNKQSGEQWEQPRRIQKPRGTLLKPWIEIQNRFQIIDKEILFDVGHDKPFYKMEESETADQEMSGHTPRVTNRRMKPRPSTNARKPYGVTVECTDGQPTIQYRETFRKMDLYCKLT